MTWREILNRRSEIELFQINTGTFHVKKNTMIMGSEVTDIKIPIYCYLLKHKKGNYLIDTGIDMSFQKKEYGSQIPSMDPDKVCKGHQQKGQSAAEYLEKNNIKIDGIFISHLHFDHTAGLIDLPQYKSVIMASSEPICEPYPPYYGDYFKHIKEYNLIDFDVATNIELLGKTIDFFGDGSFYVVLTDGHSEGHLSFLVNTQPYKYFIAGDAYIFESEELVEKGPGIYTVDYEKGHDVIRNIIKFDNEYENVKVLTGHGKSIENI